MSCDHRTALTTSWIGEVGDEWLLWAAHACFDTTFHGRFHTPQFVPSRVRNVKFVSCGICGFSLVDLNGAGVPQRRGLGSG